MMLMECPGKPGKARGKVEKSKRKFPVALPCRRLANITASTPEDRAAAEIARCLHEPNHHAIHSTVKSLGVAKAIELFNETSKIQKQGGILTSDAERNKSPGGVFLGLVKKTVTSEQKKIIFKRFRSKKKKRNHTVKQHNAVIPGDCDEPMETDELMYDPSSVTSGTLIIKVEGNDRVKGDQSEDSETDLPDPGDYGITFC